MNIKKYALIGALTLGSLIGAGNLEAGTVEFNSDNGVYSLSKGTQDQKKVYNFVTQYKKPGYDSKSWANFMSGEYIFNVDDSGKVSYVSGKKPNWVDVGVEIKPAAPAARRRIISKTPAKEDPAFHGKLSAVGEMYNFPRTVDANDSRLAKVFAHYLAQEGNGYTPILGANKDKYHVVAIRFKDNDGNGQWNPGEKIYANFAYTDGKALRVNTVENLSPAVLRSLFEIKNLKITQLGSLEQQLTKLKKVRQDTEAYIKMSREDIEAARRTAAAQNEKPRQDDAKKAAAGVNSSAGTPKSSSKVPETKGSDKQPAAIAYRAVFGDIMNYLNNTNYRETRVGGQKVQLHQIDRLAALVNRMHHRLSHNNVRRRRDQQAVKRAYLDRLNKSELKQYFSDGFLDKNEMQIIVDTKLDKLYSLFDVRLGDRLKNPSNVNPLIDKLQSLSNWTRRKGLWTHLIQEPVDLMVYGIQDKKPLMFLEGGARLGVLAMGVKRAVKSGHKRSIRQITRTDRPTGPTGGDRFGTRL